LIRVQFHRALDVFVYARNGCLDIGLQKRGGVGFGEREREWHLAAFLSFAEVTVSDCREAYRVWCGFGNKALKLLDEIEGCCIDAGRWCARSG